MQIPQTYEQWHHCITVECGILLTAPFIAERMAVWRSEDSGETLRFRRLYGDPHWRRVLAWFGRAERELAAG